VKASYRLGILIVLGVVLASTALIVASQVFGKPEPPKRVGQDLGDQGFPLGSFRLVERSGKVVTEADLAGDVWVSAFIFTRCPMSCPKISTVMKGLQKPLGDAGVKLVSFSVDPDYDTPAVLTRYANGLGADSTRWWFLTGKQDEIVDLILHRFHLPVEKNPGLDADAKAEAVRHSPRLVLVDRGNTVVGFFDSDDPDAVRELVAKARRKASWARKLPVVNASLNGTCAVLLMIGWVLILSKQVKAHAACMIAAVVVSSVFLAFYLIYHYQVGSVSFQGTGTPKIIYLSILLSHTILATLGVVPLVSLTLIYAIRKQFDRHAPMARLTFPIWLYVSITGVVIYWMLYQMPLGTSASI
jgi:protein SCO1